MKNTMRIFVTTVVILGITYFTLGPLPLFLSDMHGDYPGPKQLSTYVVKSGQPIEWLLLHGASLDARAWIGVLQRNRAIPMTALSLSHHEDGVKYADPRSLAALDIDNYLEHHIVQKGIIGHSMASLWIADAYYHCNKCFKGLQIILLSPSIGSNMNPNDINTLNTLRKYADILPDPLLAFGAISACQGVDEELYLECKRDYLYGRLLHVNSINYYAKLVFYARDPNTIKELDYFLSHDRQNITIYIAKNDRVLDPKKIEELAKQYNISYHIIPNTAHNMLLEDDKIWLPQN